MLPWRPYFSISPWDVIAVALGAFDTKHVELTFDVAKDEIGPRHWLLNDLRRGEDYQKAVLGLVMNCGKIDDTAAIAPTLQYLAVRPHTVAAGFLAATRGATIASRRCAISGWRSISRPLKPALRQLARRPAFQVGTWAVSSVREGWYFGLV